MDQKEPQRKLLVIDDEPSTLKMLRLLLGTYGYCVLTAGGGEEGLDVFRRERPPVVITDIRMPGMDGIEVLEQLRGIDHEVEMIVITGHGDMDLAIKSLKNGASDFINKPVNRQALEIALQRAEERINLKKKIRDHARELESRVDQATAALSQQCKRLEVLVKIGRQAAEISNYDEMRMFLRENIESSTRLRCCRIMVFNSIRDGFIADDAGCKSAKRGSAAAEMVNRLEGTHILTENEIEILQPFAPEPGVEESAALLPICAGDNKPAGAALVVFSNDGTEEEIKFAGLMLSLAGGALRRIVLQDEEISNLRQIVESQGRFGNLVGAHGKMKRVYKLISNVAGSDATVLIYGESGTGKELVARRIHELSPRCSGPFLPLNCAAFPLTLLESELFGHEKGAFTGAIHTRRGAFELANGGTLFLDEVGDIPPPAQVKLLRVLQFREFQRLGSEALTRTDVRVLAATSRNLREEIERGNFREDLYYRLHVIPVALPPLRERLSDLPLLASNHLEHLSRVSGKKIDRIHPHAMQVLLNYNWPGNVRELENVIEHAFILAGTDRITAGDLPAYLREQQKTSHLMPDGLDEVEHTHLVRILNECHGNKIAAARRLKISRSTLYRKIEQFGIK